MKMHRGSSARDASTSGSREAMCTGDVLQNLPGGGLRVSDTASVQEIEAEASIHHGVAAVVVAVIMVVVVVVIVVVVVVILVAAVSKFALLRFSLTHSYCTTLSGALGGKATTSAGFGCARTREVQRVILDNSAIRSELEINRKHEEEAVTPRKNPKQHKHISCVERTRFSRIAFTVLFSPTCPSCLFRAQAVAPSV